MFLIFFGIVFMSCSRKQTGSLRTRPLLIGPFPNIKIHESQGGTGPCEPSISIHPKNQNKIVAASVLNNVYTSTDKGKTWTLGKLNSTHGVYGDPVVRHDRKGNVYYSHLANSNGRAYASEEFLDRIVVQKSTDHGKTWTNGTFPPVDHKKDHDKQWKVFHPDKDLVAMTWTQFDKYGSSDSIHRSRILFSLSRDEGNTWSEAVVISDRTGDCLDDDMTTEGAYPAFGIHGEIFVVWCYDQKIWLDISYDLGKTWGMDRVIGHQSGGWSFSVPGIKRCNGFPVLKVDHSTTARRGNLYVQWGEQVHGSNNTDIRFISSSDAGKTWSSVKTVHEQSMAAHQFFSWMDIDITTGYIYLVYYDRRKYKDESTDVYLAYSTDGGIHFTEVKISETPFLPKTNVFFGDYNDISAVNGVIRPIWTRQENSVLSIYTALIQHK